MKNNPNIIKTSILLIDTAPETNRQLHAALGGVFDLVYTTTAANDLDNTLKRAAPSLIIFEIFDAGRSGFNKCREITFNDGIRDLPVVVVISANEVDYMSTGYYMGASDYMVKPLIPAEVLARVGGQLEMASASRAIRKIDKSFANEPSLATIQRYENEIGNATVLVVDDCIDSLEPLTQVLANSYEIYSAQNGLDALALTKQHRFDIILLDVVMPDMSGYEVC
ncbi:MAG TPA: response regulator, partial [Marinagarivorans sp.]